MRHRLQPMPARSLLLLIDPGDKPIPGECFRLGEHLVDRAKTIVIVTAIQRPSRSIVRTNDDAMVRYVFRRADGRAWPDSRLTHSLDGARMHDGRFMRSRGGPNVIPPDAPIPACLDGSRRHLPTGWTGAMVCDQCGAELGFCCATARWYDADNRPARLDLDYDTTPF